MTMVSGRSAPHTGAEAPEISRCPVCGGAERVLLDLGEVPVNVTALHRSAAAALAAPSGRFELTLCDGCGYVRNRAFDESLLTYDEQYENALDFSPTFREYRDHLADALFQRYGLGGREIVEIGCGQGAFLAALCRDGRARGRGFDPSHRPGDEPLPGTVRIERTHFDPALHRDGGALLCGRHVLEHLPDPLAFLTALRPATSAVYLEVPSGNAVFGGDGCWDLIYQHVSYFSAATLVRLLERAGFGVTDVRERFGDQYLSVEARNGGASTVTRPDVASFVQRADDGAATLRGRLAAARHRIRTEHAAGRTVAIWGAGAKAATFLNLVGEPVDAAVDLNPRKHGTFVAGTAVEIAAPARLATLRPGTVFIFNPVYRTEIASELASLDVAAEVLLP